MQEIIANLDWKAVVGIALSLIASVVAVFTMGRQTKLKKYVVKATKELDARVTTVETAIKKSVGL